MHRILRLLLVFIILAAAGFAKPPDLPDKTSSWELVTNQNPKLRYGVSERFTERMRVPGGWIYQTTIVTVGPEGRLPVAMAMTFVPDSAADAPATGVADDGATAQKNLKSFIDLNLRGPNGEIRSREEMLKLWNEETGGK